MNIVEGIINDSAQVVKGNQNSRRRLKFAWAAWGVSPV